ncbi:MAG: AAA family ATPase, partial [Bacteroidia bacterium]
ELVFNFYNDARQLKGRTVELFPVKGGEDKFTIASGWGSDFRGTWFLDHYTVEIVFMDTLIAVIPFTVGFEFEQGAPRLMQGQAPVSFTLPTLPDPSEVDDLSLDEVLAELEGLVGLTEIKTRMREYAQYLQFINIRKAKGLEEGSTINLHAVFKGNPGTGKTTVARQLGRIYRKLGLLTRGHIHEVDRADLVGEYIGHTAPRVREAIQQARGGILFIDEAYALMRDKEDSKDFGREVIELLVKEMSNGPGDLAVVVAGYPKEMESFMKSNPGLRSRFPTAFVFDDYIPDELSEIAQYAASKRQVELTGDAQERLHEHLIEAYRKRDRSFGNARYVFSMIDEAKLNLGLRIMKGESPDSLSLEDLSRLTENDILEIFNRKNRKTLSLPIDEDLLQQSLDQLNELVGLHDVKNEVHELVKLVRYYRETDLNVLNRFSLHSVFVGNPGTGKTTVAHLIGQIYRALGILERGEVVVADRASLVAQFIGQTAPKVEAAMEKARGSVLFIDEAYTLAQGGANDFGREAIDALLTRMEEMRGELVVIVAGYPDNMRQFLEANPGLKSRFDRQLTFPDYTPEELITVARSMLAQEGIIPVPDAEKHLEQYLNFIYNNRNKYFGNARAVRRVVELAIKQQHLRLAALPAKKRTKVASRTLILEDVEQFTAGDLSLLDVGKQGKVGF